MRILLINSKISGGKPWLPLGLDYVAAFLWQMMPKSHLDIKIIESNLRGYARAFDKTI